MVADLLEARDCRCLIHALNLCEVHYDALRRKGTEALDSGELVELVQGLGLLVVEDLEQGLWSEAARLKALFRRVSLADCVAAALANRENAALVTSDRSELGPLAEAKECSVRFIR